MEFFRFLRRESETKFGYLLAAAIVAGLANAFLVVVLIDAVSKAYDGADSFRSFLLFALSFGTFAFCRQFTISRTGMLVERIVSQVRLRIMDKIRRASLLQFEQTGRAAIYSAVVQQTRILSQSAALITTSFSSAITVVLVAALLAYASKPALAITAGTVAVGLFIYWIERRKMESTLAKAAEEENVSVDYVNHILDGFIEVRMHAGRNEDLFKNHLVSATTKSEKLKVAACDQIAFLVMLSQGFSYVILAALIFILPAYVQGGTGSLAQVAALILLVAGPVSEVIGALPWLARTQGAIATIEKLKASLETAEEAGALEEVRVLNEPVKFEELACEQVRFQYSAPGAEGFALGPIDFKVKPGEIVFIAGPNGNGKSTFLKVLTGLYPIQSGKISYNGRPFDPKHLSEYRSLFSTASGSSHFFERLHGLGDCDAERLGRMISDLQMAGEVDVEAGEFQTAELSMTQRRRLAIMVAELEQRPVFVFDEVASGQPQHFRKHFYEVMLPRWQKQGKTMIVVTQDDQYFHVADRILKMGYGMFERARV